ncbi:hypothetical protein B0J14DRAFT_38157 [Halenospora varia]|nr:hypothetical protein B0J14DRAFT_38157 [Halenospora varia]
MLPDAEVKSAQGNLFGGTITHFENYPPLEEGSLDQCNSTTGRNGLLDPGPKSHQTNTKNTLLSPLLLCAMRTIYLLLPLRIALYMPSIYGDSGPQSPFATLYLGFLLPIFDFTVQIPVFPHLIEFRGPPSIAQSSHGVINGSLNFGSENDRGQRDNPTRVGACTRCFTPYRSAVRLDLDATFEPKYSQASCLSVRHSFVL